MNFVGVGVGANILSQVGTQTLLNGHLIHRLTSLNPTRLNFSPALFTDTIFTQGYAHGGDEIKIEVRKLKTE